MFLTFVSFLTCLPLMLVLSDLHWHTIDALRRNESPEAHPRKASPLPTIDCTHKFILPYHRHVVLPSTTNQATHCRKPYVCVVAARNRFSPPKPKTGPLSPPPRPAVPLSDFMQSDFPRRASDEMLVGSSPHTHNAVLDLLKGIHTRPVGALPYCTVRLLHVYTASFPVIGENHLLSSRFSSVIIHHLLLTEDKERWIFNAVSLLFVQ